MEKFDINKISCGLTDSEVSKNKNKYGTNKLSEAKKESIWDMFKEALSDVCIIVLLFALGVKIVLTILSSVIPGMQGGNDAVEIISIIMAIALATGFSVLSDYRNQTRSSALQEEYGKTYAKVIRNGALESILTSEITMNDIILLQAGDKIPADGLIVKGDIKVSQAALNGESRDENKSAVFLDIERNGKKLSNVFISDIEKGDIFTLKKGNKIPFECELVSGTVEVTRTIDEKVETVKENTPGIKLNNIDVKLTEDVVVKALVDSNVSTSTDYSSESKVFMGSVVTSGEAYMMTTVLGDESELGKINQSLNDSEENEVKDATTLKLEKLVGQIGKLGTVSGVLAGVLLVVCDIFRGNVVIETAVIISLIAEAIMLGASILIMAIPEGLALIVSLIQSMNTENMYKHNILVSHKNAFSDSAFLNILFSDKTGTITQGVLSLVEFITGDGEIITNLKTKEFIDSITINNLAKVSEGKAIGSNNMDRALLTYALANGYDGSTREEEKIKELSGFDSEKKCATAKMIDGSVYWKGATENIIDKVTHYIDDNGEEKTFSEDNKKTLKEKMIEQSSRAMKLLSVAKIYDEKTVLLAVLCLRDDVRPDAVETVEELTNAGIQVVMVTGDMKETAVAIAKDSKILRNDTDIVLTHEELESLSDDELKEKLPNLRVVSRAKPLDKKRLVNIAQSIGNVCGMTGDGVNDAPALKSADCGFAMGDGTAVAQEAGDVIILNNSLTSIKDAILNARTMMKSISKFLIFQLTVNISTLLMNIISPIIGISEPFSIVSILYVNLIMDTCIAIAIGGEPVLERYMEEKPAKRDDNILTKYIKTSILIGSIFITIGSIFILKDVFGITSMLMPATFTDKELYAKSLMFAFFIYSVLFNSLNIRSEKFNLFEDIKENKRFVYVMGLIFIIQTIIMEFAGPVFGIVKLDIPSLLISMAAGSLIIPIDMIKKIVTKSYKNN